MNKKAIIESNQLTKRFEGLVAVKNMNLVVREGSKHAIIGPNGSGKTTLINLITGYYECDGGSLRFLEKDITNIEAYVRNRMGMSRTFQTIRLLDELSVYDNIALGMYSTTSYSFMGAMLHSKKYKEQEKKVREKAEQLAEELKITSLLKQGISKLPYGQRRLVEIARALMPDPILIMLDEPAAGMNTVETIELGNTVNRISEKGITVLLIEHNMEFIKDISDTVTVMESGEKIAEGDFASISCNPAVIEAYLGKGVQKHVRN